MVPTFAGTILFYILFLLRTIINIKAVMVMPLNHAKHYKGHLPIARYV